MLRNPKTPGALTPRNPKHPETLLGGTLAIFVFLHHDTHACSCWAGSRFNCTYSALSIGGGARSFCIFVPKRLDPTGLAAGGSGRREHAGGWGREEADGRGGGKRKNIAGKTRTTQTSLKHFVSFVKSELVTILSSQNSLLHII